jgi:hypothetical protein
MARTTPVHEGYTIVNGAGTGPNGDRIDVWIEYKLIHQALFDVNNRHTSWVDFYFYAALKPGQSSSTNGASGAYAEIELYQAEYPEDPWSIFAGGNNLPYDFRSTNINNDFTLDAEVAHTYPVPADPFEWDDYLPWPFLHDSDGVCREKIRASFTTPSSFITGGYVSEFTPALPDIPCGKFRARAGDTWKSTEVYVRGNSFWRPGDVWVKDGGIWKQGV